MEWITPKTNWRSSDFINVEDYNRIKNNALYLIGATESALVDYPNSLSVYYYQDTGTVRRWNTIAFPETDCSTSPITHQKLYRPYARRTIIIGSNVFADDETTDTDLVLPTRTYTAAADTTYTAIYRYHQYGVKELPDFADMGNDKSDNAFWYADEVNAIIENIDKIAEATGTDYPDKPFYFPNGQTPTAFELNNIEREEQLLYNRINRTYAIYLGTSGSIGARISNVRL